MSKQLQKVGKAAFLQAINKRVRRWFLVVFSFLCTFGFMVIHNSNCYCFLMQDKNEEGKSTDNELVMVDSVETPVSLKVGSCVKLLHEFVLCSWLNFRFRIYPPVKQTDDINLTCLLTEENQFSSTRRMKNAFFVNVHFC